MAATLLAAEEEEQAQLDATGLVHGAFRGGLAGAMVCLARADHLRLAESCRILRRWTTPFVRTWTARPRAGVGDPPVAQIAARFTMLQVVDVRNFRWFTDAFVAALAAGCPQLMSVNLSGCRQFTDASVAVLAAGCPLLTSVCLSKCEQITDASVAALAAGCPQLTSVNLYGCRQITGASVAALRSQTRLR